MKRVAVALGLVLAACGSKGKPSDRHPMRGTDRVPSVTSAAVLAADVLATPPLLVIVDADGIFYLGAAATWDELTTTDPLATARSSRLRTVEVAVSEAAAAKATPGEALAAFVDNELNPLGHLIERVPVAYDRYSGADPPPPEGPEESDDGTDESGGIGTRGTLEERGIIEEPSEWKMGRKEAPLASAFASFEDLAAYQRGATQYEPGWRLRLQRAALVSGEVALGGYVGARQRALVLAAPTAPASVLISAVAGTEGLIAVQHDGRVRPLRIEFLENHGDGVVWESDWIELRVGAHDLAIEVPPGDPIALADARPEMLAAALRAARWDANRYDDTSTIDVLVDRTVSAQRLVDVLAALDLAGERAIGLGDAPEPGSAEAAVRGRYEPTLSLGQPNAQGDLDKKIIRRYIKHRRWQFLACYRSAIQGRYSISGTVSTQFFITPDGTVASVSAYGVHPAVSDCFAAVIKSIEFPKPRGGGGVQVNYPFTMRR